MIVEDHPTMREAMRLVLEGEGFVIEEAADGQTALAAIRERPPDLLFLDLNIPGISGGDVLLALSDRPGENGGRLRGRLAPRCCLPGIRPSPCSKTRASRSMRARR